MSTRVELVTADELLRMPRGKVRRELIAGELREMTPTGFEHGNVAINFTLPLASYVKEHNFGKVHAGETGFILSRDPDTVRSPDVMFISHQRLASLSKPRGYFPGAPDLAVEVISPNDTYSEVEAKVEEWLSAGCRMVVVANPRNCTLKVYNSPTEILVLGIEDIFSGADVLPGFQLPVREIFTQ